MNISPLHTLTTRDLTAMYKTPGINPITITAATQDNILSFDNEGAFKTMNFTVLPDNSAEVAMISTTITGKFNLQPTSEAARQIHKIQQFQVESNLVLAGTLLLFCAAAGYGIKLTNFVWTSLTFVGATATKLDYAQMPFSASGCNQVIATTIQDALKIANL